MKVLVKNLKEFQSHNKTMENRVASAPYLPTHVEPADFPCMVVSYINTGVNGFMIKHEFVYLSDFTCLNKKM